MRKIVSLFQRNYDGDRLVRDEVVPGAEWVVAGEGVATRKWDGTACMVRDGVLYKRFDRKAGKLAPEGWEAAQEPDAVTGHWPGWVPIGDGPEDRWAREAWAVETDRNEFWPHDGTFELIGPKVNGGSEGVERHQLVEHGRELLPDAPRTYAAIRSYFEANPIEGIVWHRDKGDMVKIKARDFGLRWPRR